MSAPVDQHRDVDSDDLNEWLTTLLSGGELDDRSKSDLIHCFTTAEIVSAGIAILWQDNPPEGVALGEEQVLLVLRNVGLEI